MKEIGAVTLLPVPGLEPDIDDTLDQLEDKFVPIEEDALPQGVLDLIVVLTVRHRSLSPTGNSHREGVASVRTVHKENPDETERRTPLRTEIPALSQRLAHLRMGFVQPVMTNVALAAPRSEVSVVPIEHTIRPIETPLVERQPPQPQPQAQSSEPAITAEDVHAAVAMPTGSFIRQLQAIAPVVIHRPDAMPPAVPLAMTVTELETPGRDFLQVPFNKGAANGQVTITRRPGESVPNLILSPSNIQVLEHLREPFEQSRDNHWRLTDTADEQPHHGSHHAPDDEPEDPEETPA